MLSFKQIKKFFLEGESLSLMKNFFGRNKCLHKEVANNVLTTRAKKTQNIKLFWLYFIIMSRTCFRVNLHSIVNRMSRNSLLETGQYLKFKWQQSDSNSQPLSLLTNTCLSVHLQTKWLWVWIPLLSLEHSFFPIDRIFCSSVILRNCWHWDYKHFLQFLLLE